MTIASLADWGCFLSASLCTLQLVFLPLPSYRDRSIKHYPAFHVCIQTPGKTLQTTWRSSYSSLASGLYFEQWVLLFQLSIPQRSLIAFYMYPQLRATVMPVSFSEVSPTPNITLARHNHSGWTTFSAQNREGACSQDFTPPFQISPFILCTKHNMLHKGGKTLHMMHQVSFAKSYLCGRRRYSVLCRIGLPSRGKP